MTETDSIRLARMEEKLDAWMDRADERHANTCRDIDDTKDQVCKLKREVSGLKEDRAKIVGAAMVGGAVIGWLGNMALKFWPGGK